MRIFILFFAYLILHQVVHSQELTPQQRSELRNLFGEERMQVFKDNYPELSVQVIFLNSLDRMNNSDSLLFLMNETSVRETKDEDGNLVYYKLFESKSSINYKLRTIFFDAKKISLETINESRTKIMENINSGQSFESQYEKYNTDNRANFGDLGWTEAENLLEPFTSLVKINPIGKAYIVDIPYMNWYYIAENKAEPKENIAKKFLKITIQK